ncbi:hypothetical protein BDS110ZK25_46180 [Bradyrhizobium diazoefficiens]|uniref:Uncharacterized protein n=1 Tax=Bradyrhizobium diazoefficiens TaxID=1355477 RepID=A0A809Y7S1_9BRAD|nr:hypothetical protein F07S3_87020 [Bradyrhizobium diazoefficiens]BCA07914.1 hypothetical protein H12S4_88180 [Bradyrhizobium diazoefficiens]BCA16558.1 hypothetical protein BDHF08_84050 [Bradyrhizobium diazoefficiens]BCA25267.1 hypothetical protein BDHH15_84820 [Bradyrhizobium diazoefficiens]BCE25990.1 hypothetical protein XF1B_86710 [Bradyrhizobium diazoefficiens]
MRRISLAGLSGRVLSDWRGQRKVGVGSYPPGEGKIERYFCATTAASVTASQLKIITVPPVGAA